MVFKDKKVRFTQALLKAGHTLRDMLYKCHTYMLHNAMHAHLFDKMHVRITFLQYALQFVYKLKKNTVPKSENITMNKKLQCLPSHECS